MDDLSQTNITLRVALSVAVLVAAFVMLGPIGVLVSCPIPAFLLARPVLQLFSSSVHETKRLALHSLEGVYYSFRGTPLTVLEDEDQNRWVAVDDARKVLTTLPRDQVLAKLAPAGLQRAEGEPGGFLRVDDLIAMLSKAQAIEAIKFKTWLRRDVYFPSGAAKRAGARPTSSA